ncbi:N-acetyltransferase [Brachybacterium sp. MASK1Z-5]|uniref:N-acetyltransferase n=1 Tax=Brachybacterium halotolerans TaxID=2795215 RepID=A0ABS1BBU1_9MICO|nr:N-acetyltransferase [Brachybacterium halotolerans]MBK0331942.1 N-acetyltransferase [Brachybacterium halotolerans]
MTECEWLVRPEEPGDVEAVRMVIRSAFETSDEADLVDRLRTDPAWVPGLSYVACAPDARVVAHALLTRCHIGDVPALCLAPCAVLPGAQRRGAGAAVIGALLHAAGALGERFVVVLGHPGYYPRFGFEPAIPQGIRLSIDVPADALMVTALDDAGPLPTGVVRYAEPFGI